jgi:hypothetical protein
MVFNAKTAAVILKPSSKTAVVILKPSSKKAAVILKPSSKMAAVISTYCKVNIRGITVNMNQPL